MDQKIFTFVNFHNSFFQHLALLENTLKNMRPTNSLSQQNKNFLIVSVNNVLDLYVQNIIPHIVGLYSIPISVDTTLISQIIFSKNINGELATLTQSIKDLAEQDVIAFNSDSLTDIRQSKAPAYVSETTAVDIDVCCGAKMVVMYEESKLICISCGKVKDLVSTIFNDAQLFAMDASKSKQSYAPKRNFSIWMDKILAKGKFDIPVEDLRKIKNEMKMSGYRPGAAEQLTIREIRGYLKTVGLTKYNTHASYLLAVLSGIPPPCYSQTDITKISKFYDKILELLSTQSAAKTNTPHCPYFIYRIIQILWPRDKEKLRLLKYICLQHSDTVRFNDENYWKPICLQLHLKYEPLRDYRRFD